MLSKNDHILDDLETQLMQIQAEKEFVDSCKLKLPSDIFMRYLSLYLYPSKIRDMLDQKLHNVADEKKRLGAMLTSDIDHVNHKVGECQCEINKIK